MNRTSLRRPWTLALGIAVAVAILPASPAAAASTTVDNETAGAFTASANWGTSAFSAQRFGANYRFAEPDTTASDAAWYRFNLPATGSYLVEAWYPANAGYSSGAPYVIATTAGNVTVRVDQRANGGRWVALGTFTLAAGDHHAVGISRWTSAAGLIIADAVRITDSAARRLSVDLGVW
jgi:hypothetical protein